MVMMYIEKVKVLNNFFALVFPTGQASHVAHFPELIDEGWGNKVLPTVNNEHLIKVDMCKSTGLNVMHLRVLKGLADLVAKPLLHI